MADLKVVIAESRYDTHEYEMAVLKEVGAEVVLERSDDPQKIVEVAKDADAMIVNLAPITAAVISQLEKCKCISRYGVGVDNVDIAAATEKKIAVLNVRNYCNDDVSEHALALMMSCGRKTVLMDRHVRKGEWNIPERIPIYRMVGKVLGLVGCGAIGKRLVQKASGIGLAETLVYDPFVSTEDIAAMGAKKAELDEVLKASDYISVHAPLMDETRHMIGSEQFKMMKSTAILVNTSRGPLVDTDALYGALKNGEIGAAGIDVFEEEPAPKDCKLFELENVVLTDHAGWYSEESHVELQTLAAKNVALMLKGEAPLYCVNPEVLG